MPTDLYYTQGIRGFQQTNVEYFKNKVVYRLRRTEHRCPSCGAKDVFAESLGDRNIHGEPMGRCREVTLHYTAHRIYCRKCHQRNDEHIPFLSHPKSRLTKIFERTLVELRRDMSIRAISNYFHVRWNTIKNLEKKYLEKKFSKVNLAQIRMIGVDEIYLCRRNEIKYLTVVRDQESGEVLHVGDGKGITALNGLEKRLKKSKLKDTSINWKTWLKKASRIRIRHGLEQIS